MPDLWMAKQLWTARCMRPGRARRTGYAPLLQYGSSLAQAAQSAAGAPLQPPHGGTGFARVLTSRRWRAASLQVALRRPAGHGTALPRSAPSFGRPVLSGGVHQLDDRLSNSLAQRAFAVSHRGDGKRARPSPEIAPDRTTRR